MKPFIENKNVLVLGGAGFIGSHLCEELVKRGDNVVCVDNFISSDVENIRSLLEYPNFEFIRHNIIENLEWADVPGLQKFKVEVQGFQEIYNLACPTSPKDYSKFPVETATANSVGVVNSLEWARKYKSRYLLTSTSAVYGNPPADGDGRALATLRSLVRAAARRAGPHAQCRPHSRQRLWQATSI